MDATVRTSAADARTDLEQARLALTRAIADHVDQHTKDSKKRVEECRAEVLRLERNYDDAHRLKLQAALARQTKPKTFLWIFERR